MKNLDIEFANSVMVRLANAVATDEEGSTGKSAAVRYEVRVKIIDSEKTIGYLTKAKKPIFNSGYFWGETCDEFGSLQDGIALDDDDIASAALSLLAFKLSR